MADQTQPEDYDPVFDQGVVIVGGQAVNIWAEVYAARGDRILETFAPFMSKDADPDIMLKAKMANLAGIWQDDRDDERHVRIMILCCRHYLRDAATAVKNASAHRTAVSDSRSGSGDRRFFGDGVREARRYGHRAAAARRQ